MKGKPFQIGLGIASVLIILGGQFMTEGALYGYWFMGIAGGITVALNEVFQPSANGWVALIFGGVLFSIATMILIYGSLFLALVLSTTLTIRFSASVSSFVSFLFGGISVTMVSGLILFSWLSSRADPRGEVHLENHFFIWPALFGLMAILYSRLNQMICPK